MELEPEVQIVADDGIKNQFGRGFFAYKREPINSKKVAIVSVAVLVCASIPVLLSGPPDSDDGTRSDLIFSGEVAPGQAVILPAHKPDDPNDKGRSKESGEAGGKRRVEKLPGPKLLARPRDFKVPPGTMVKAVLLSGASNGPVRAQLEEPVALNGETFIENGAVLMGTGQSSEERLFIHFTKVVFKDGSVETIEAQAADFEDKIAGLNGSKVGNYALKLGAAIGLNFVTGMSEGLQDSDVQNGVAVKKPTIKNALYNGTAMAASEQAQQLLSTAKSKQPIIEVSSGTSLYILFDSDRQ